MLRSAKEIEGYVVCDTDGDVGHVKDLYLDDEKSRIGLHRRAPGSEFRIPTRTGSI